MPAAPAVEPPADSEATAQRSFSFSVPGVGPTRMRAPEA